MLARGASGSSSGIGGGGEDEHGLKGVQAPTSNLIGGLARTALLSLGTPLLAS